MKIFLLLLTIALAGCHSKEPSEETLLHRTAASGNELKTTSPSTPAPLPQVDTLQTFVDQFPERVEQQIAFIRKRYAQIVAEKEQFDCYERFQIKGTDTFVLVPKDSAKHVYGEEPYDTPVYYYQGDSLEGGVPFTLFYKNENGTALIEEINYDTAEGASSEKREFYFSENQLLFMFHHYEHIDFWTKHDEGSEKQARQYRYYFLDGRPIRCLKKEYTGFEDAPTMIAHQPNQAIPLEEGNAILCEAQPILNSVGEELP